MIKKKKKADFLVVGLYNPDSRNLMKSITKPSLHGNGLTIYIVTSTILLGELELSSLTIWPINLNSAELKILN